MLSRFSNTSKTWNFTPLKFWVGQVRQEWEFFSLWHDQFFQFQLVTQKLKSQEESTQEHRCYVMNFSQTVNFFQKFHVFLEYLFFSKFFRLITMKMKHHTIIINSPVQTLGWVSSKPLLRMSVKAVVGSVIGEIEAIILSTGWKPSIGQIYPEK